MPTIVYQTNSRGTKYAYESVSYWDKDKKAPRSKRKYIGRVDPETGEIIPPRSNKNTAAEQSPPPDSSFSANSEIAKLRSELAHKDEEIDNLNKKLCDTRAKYSAAMDTLSKIYASAADVLKLDRN